MRKLIFEFSTGVAEVLLKNKNTILLLAVLLTIGSGYFVTKLKFNFSPEKIFLQNDPAQEFLEEVYNKEFSYLGTPCVLAVTSQSEELTEAILLKASNTLESVDHVERVVSAFSQPVLSISKTGGMTVRKATKNNKLTKEAKEYFSKNANFSKLFFADDFKTQALVFFLPIFSDNLDLQNKVVEKIQEEMAKLQESHPQSKIIISGLPFIQNDMVQLLQKDQVVFIPIVILFIILLLFIITKHPLGAIFPIVTIVTALIWTLGYLGLVGQEINIVNHSMLVLIIVIGIADSVHIYIRFLDEMSKNHESKTRALNVTIKNMLLPCFLTTATTALGFFASSVAGVKIIQDFGEDTAVGVLLCFLATFMIMPAFLSWHPRVLERPKRHIIRRFRVENILRLLTKFSLKYGKALIAITIVLFLGSLFLIKDIKSNQNWISELPKDHRASLSLKFIEEKFGGIMPFYVVFSGETQSLMSFDTFKKLDELSEAIKNYPLSPNVVSLSESVKNTFGLNDLSQENWPMVKNFVEQAILKNSKDSGFFSEKGNHLRLEGSLKNTSSKEVETFREFLEKQLDEIKIDGVKVNLTGSALISAKALNNIISDMAKSIIVAILVILLFISLIFRSVSYGVIAMLPNILPITLTLAVLQLLEIEMRLATVMIFSMTLGISVDNCIHLLSRFKEEKGKGKLSKTNLIKVIYRAFNGSGKAIFYATIILCGGFSIIAFSEFLAMKDFAIISGVTLVSALLADIILLPALMLLGRKIFKL